MNKLISSILLFTLSVWSTTSAYAKQDIHQYTLANGMQVYVKPDHRSPSVISMVIYKVGSADEPGGLSGISHVLEHMMFKGTDSLGPNEFSKLIAAQGGIENAFTSYDLTGYFQKLSADKLPISLKLEADRMQNLQLAQQEFDKELQVVQEERRMRTDDNPHAATFEQFNAAAHQAHPYHHPIIGWKSDLDQLQLIDLQNWYDTWYTPGNAALLVIGDVEPKQVHRLAKQYFSKIPAKPVPASKAQSAPPTYGTRNITVNLPATQPLLIMGYNTPSLVTVKEPWQAYALYVAAALLTDGDSSRLIKSLVRDRQIVTDISASYDLLNRFDGLFSISAIAAQNVPATEVTQAIFDEIDRLANEPVSKQELARVKALTIASQVYRQDSLYGQSMLLAMLIANGLPVDLSTQWDDKIGAVTAEQIQAVVKQYLIPQRLTIAELIPQPIQS
jgi:zinc protease